MHKRYTTTDGAQRNQEADYWREVISEALFNLQVAFNDDGAVRGQLDQWDLAPASLSLLVSGGLDCKRLRQHCDKEERQLLLTVPVQGDVEFSQLGRTTRCAPGQFVLELSEEPYEFGCGQDSTMWVLKVPVSAVKARIGEPRRFCARQYDGSQGVGRLFHDYLQLVTQHCELGHSHQLLSMMGTHLIDLLSLSLQQHPDALQSEQSAVRDAHLVRIEAYVRRHLSDPELSPGTIAEGCGISPRYLHLLFKDTGEPVSQWIRGLRLQFAHEALNRADRSTSVAQIAYAAGFGDHAKFTHAFSRKFGHAPSELLRAARAK
ncbi:Transcriptional activator NphR [Variovorax sp. PBS-H4]|uniref:AraC-like ligand-binding domain-containing protein n=1 Tax=Variovorax sp. PBS-H4 TaxID=434008 RepID=UPI0013195F9C|nr:helix-turn-helix domain-containing protein [Variovorax sp. PBS-H4]VTU37648.1 Transcriptional activator NphR [Variovorax sp. PBS-H4]